MSQYIEKQVQKNTSDLKKILEDSKNINELEFSGKEIDDEDLIIYYSKQDNETYKAKKKELNSDYYNRRYGNIQFRKAESNVLNSNILEVDDWVYSTVVENDRFLISGKFTGGDPLSLNSYDQNTVNVI